MKNGIVSVLFMLLGLVSCMDKQDFDQIDDIAANPVIEGSVLFVESPEGFLNQFNSPDFYSEEFSFHGFSEEIFADRVLDGTLFYELENTTSKELEVTIEFLNEAGDILDETVINIDPAPVDVVERKVEYGVPPSKSIDVIKNTVTIRVSVRNLGDTTSISNLPDPKVVFRSSAKFRMDIR